MSYYPYPTQVMVSPPRRTSTAHLVIAWVVAIVTALYMLPWAIAATRDKSNAGAIALINLFLGWSVIGWVVALVMSCSVESRQPQVIVMNGHGMPAYPVQGRAQTYSQSIYPQAYPQQQLPAACPQVAPAPYLAESYAPATVPYPASPATSPYPTSSTPAPRADPWARSADPVGSETVPLQLTDPYAGAAEITRPLPALSDPWSEGHGRQ